MKLPALPAKAGQKLTLGQLTGSSLSLMAARLTQEAHRPVLLVTADTPSALRLEQELQYLLADTGCPVLLFPDWETLPYDTFSPHQDIISQRLETLYKLPQMSSGVLIVPISTLMLRTAPRVYLDKYSLMVKSGQRLNLQQLRARLAEAGYVAVEQVLEHGEFAARGSLLDLFPMGSSSPIASTSSTTRWTPSARSTPRPSAPANRSRASACCRPGSFPPTRGPSSCFAASIGNSSRSPAPRAPSIRR